VLRVGMPRALRVNTPKPGAREKDVLKNFLHRAVCGGAMTLEDAQRKIATDWYKAYQEMRGINP
jgi:hypothetical protein